MVNFVDLRDAKPTLWKTAADDWVSLAQEAEQAANNIYDQGTSALNEHWTDEVGQRAAQKLKELANSYQVAAATIRGVVFTLDGLGESVESLQRSPQSAVDYAQRCGAGQTGRRGRQPRSGQGANEIQQSAPENQLQLMREALPIGEDPRTVAAWWNSLTPEQQAEFERVVPVDLNDLNGIPEDVKKMSFRLLDLVDLVGVAQQRGACLAEALGQVRHQAANHGEAGIALVAMHALPDRALLGPGDRPLNRVAQVAHAGELREFLMGPMVGSFILSLYPSTLPAVPQPSGKPPYGAASWRSSS